mmetsp:Transcript_19100/g.40263  ORF Transcript_19100/g.40263 Transcript_19100/m.40263 type:complete len:583 (-) Transcript_19100:174-1922(-)
MDLRRSSIILVLGAENDSQGHCQAHCEQAEDTANDHPHSRSIRPLLFILAAAACIHCFHITADLPLPVGWLHGFHLHRLFGRPPPGNLRLRHAARVHDTDRHGDLVRARSSTPRALPDVGGVFRRRRVLAAIGGDGRPGAHGTHRPRGSRDLCHVFEVLGDRRLVLLGTRRGSGRRSRCASRIGRCTTSSGWRAAPHHRCALYRRRASSRRRRAPGRPGRRRPLLRRRAPCPHRRHRSDTGPRGHGRVCGTDGILRQRLLRTSLVHLHLLPGHYGWQRRDGSSGSGNLLRIVGIVAVYLLVLAHGGERVQKLRLASFVFLDELVNVIDFGGHDLLHQLLHQAPKFHQRLPADRARHGRILHIVVTSRRRFPQRRRRQLHPRGTHGRDAPGHPSARVRGRGGCRERSEGLFLVRRTPGGNGDGRGGGGQCRSGSHRGSGSPHATPLFSIAIIQPGRTLRLLLLLLLLLFRRHRLHLMLPIHRNRRLLHLMLFLLRTLRPFPLPFVLQILLETGDVGVDVDFGAFDFLVFGVGGSFRLKDFDFGFSGGDLAGDVELLFELAELFELVLEIVELFGRRSGRGCGR